MNITIKKVCPYFKENKCTAKLYITNLKFKDSFVPICETIEFMNCPVYSEIQRLGKINMK